MRLNTTNYSIIAKYLSENFHLVDEAESYQDLTQVINKQFNRKMNSATVHTIVAAIYGTMLARADALVIGTPDVFVAEFRLTLNDPLGNESWLTITRHNITMNNSHCSLSLSNLQYKGDLHYDLRDLFKRELYDDIVTLINNNTVGTVVKAVKNS